MEIQTVLGSKRLHSAPVQYATIGGINYLLGEDCIALDFGSEVKEQVGETVADGNGTVGFQPTSWQVKSDGKAQVTGQLVVSGREVNQCVHGAQ